MGLAVDFMVLPTSFSSSGSSADFRFLCAAQKILIGIQAHASRSLFDAMQRGTHRTVPNIFCPHDDFGREKSLYKVESGDTRQQGAPRVLR
jgi:hypothetical protein